MEPLYPSQSRKLEITERRESTLKISRASRKEKQKSSRNEVAKSREKDRGEAKNYVSTALFDMVSHWHL